MLEEIKKIQGINHSDFDSMINTWIKAAELDLKSIGIVDTLITTPDELVQTAIITYVLSQLDVVNAELYSNSYTSYSIPPTVALYLGTKYDGLVIASTNARPFS